MIVCDRCESKQPFTAIVRISKRESVGKKRAAERTMVRFSLTLCDACITDYLESVEGWRC